MKVSASSKKIDPDTTALNNGLSMTPNTGNDQSHKQRNRYRRVFDWPIKAKFNVEPPWEGGRKVCINGPGHMTKMAPCPYMVKTFKNLLQNQKSYDLETWHAASGTQALQRL